MKISIKRIILLLITIIFLYFVFKNLDIKELLRIIKNFDLKYIILVTISIICSFTFRGFCFKQLIYRTVKPPLKDLTLLCITGAALNVVLPARAGDIFRAYYLGHKYEVDKVKVFGTIMLERIFDVIIVFCLLAIGIFFYHKNQLAMQLCIFAGVTMFLGIVFIFIAYKYNNTDKICKFIELKTKKLPFSAFFQKLIAFINKICNSFFDGFEIIESPKRICYAIMASAGIWFFECLNYLIILKGFGFDIHWSITLFIIGFIALACMVPSTSIFIGPYQVAVIAAFAIYDINKETALAASFLEQAVVLISTSIIAAIFLFENNISYKELKEDINTK